MDTCAVCGVKLAPALAWCRRCFAPTVLAKADVAGPESSAESETSSRHSEAPIPWAGPLVRHGDEEDPDPLPPPVYSRWQGGTVTFGPRGRIALTVGFLVMGILLSGLYAPLGSPMMLV